MAGLLSAWLAPAPASTATVELLYSFAEGEGAQPQGALIEDDDGRFYGTTYAGGSDGKGTIFRLSTDGELTTVVDFTGENGSHPVAGLTVGADELFYGATEQGGEHGFGTAFRTDASGQMTVLFHFDQEHGAFPRAAPVQIERPEDEESDGGTAGGGSDDEDQGALIFGVAGQGGEFGYGTVYRITAPGTIETLHSFDSQEGRHPNGHLVLSGENLLGAAEGGGTAGQGVAYQIGLDGEFSLLASFDGESQGGQPEAALLEGADGDFYGTTRSGGENQGGTVFRLSSEGQLETLAPLGGADGTGSRATLVAGTDGNFYGTTFETVFRVTPDGELTTLHSFSATTAGHSHAGLLLASDGNFYGTLLDGGEAGRGAIFRMRPPPGTPPALTATAGAGEAHLSWSPVVGAESYRIYQGEETGELDPMPVRSGITATSVTLGDLDSGTYFFAVTAVNGNGESSASSEAMVTVNMADELQFASVADAAAGTSQFSAVLTLSGLVEDTTVPISVSGDAGAAFALNEGPFQTAPARAGNGDTIQLRVTAADTPGDSVQVRVEVGHQVGVFEVTTARQTQADPVPDAFAFEAVEDVSPGTFAVSRAITVRGINVAAAIAVSGDPGASYSVNGSAFTASVGRVEAGDRVRVRVRSAEAFEAQVVVTLDIGGVTADFVAATGLDRIPDPFSVAAVDDAPPGSLQISEVIVISGIDTAVPISVSGAPGAAYRINDAAYVSQPAEVMAGDRVELRLAAPDQPDSTAVMIVSIGGETARFAVTAGRPGVQSGAVGTLLLVLLLAAAARGRLRLQRLNWRRAATLRG